MSINRVIISGNLTRDPELRMTSGGTQVMSFGVAVSDRKRNPDTGEWENYPNFVDCTMFGTRSEALSKILSKGMKVALEGRLRFSAWERDGQRRTKLEVVVDELELLSRNSDKAQVQASSGSMVLHTDGSVSEVQGIQPDIYDVDVSF